MKVSTASPSQPFLELRCPQAVNTTGGAPNLLRLPAGVLLAAKVLAIEGGLEPPSCPPCMLASISGVYRASVTSRAALVRPFAAAAAAAAM